MYDRWAWVDGRGQFAVAVRTRIAARRRTESRRAALSRVIPLHRSGFRAPRRNPRRAREGLHVAGRLPDGSLSFGRRGTVALRAALVLRVILQGAPCESLPTRSHSFRCPVE